MSGLGSEQFEFFIHFYFSDLYWLVFLSSFKLQLNSNTFSSKQDLKSSVILLLRYLYTKLPRKKITFLQRRYKTATKLHRQWVMFVNGPVRSGVSAPWAARILISTLIRTLFFRIVWAERCRGAEWVGHAERNPTRRSQPTRMSECSCLFKYLKWWKTP